jgi:hypothetical protein
MEHLEEVPETQLENWSQSLFDLEDLLEVEQSQIGLRSSVVVAAALVVVG